MEIESIKKIKLEPGEILFVRFPDDIDHDTFEASMKNLSKVLPKNTKIIGYVGPIELQAVSPADVKQIPNYQVKW